MISKTAWFCPHDTVQFVPVTPKSELASKVSEVVEEERKRIYVKVRVVEKAGTSFKRKLVRRDISFSQKCPQKDCLLCRTGDVKHATSHHRSGALYKGTCRSCKERGVKTEYTGKTGYTAYTRMADHECDIRGGNTKNAFAKHLAMHHPDEERNPGLFKFECVKIFSRCLDTQVAEAVHIFRSKADIVLNSK